MEIKEGILATIAYSDIFEYPLTLAEIHKYFYGKHPVSQDNIKKTIYSIKNIQSHEEYFFLKGRKSIVTKRKIKMEESRKKIKKAKIIAKCLAVIPTIKFIGISGSLAQKNASPQDDIDLFIVAKNDTVWITRLLVNLFLIAIFQKRKKKVRLAPDKICPNMIVSETSLSLPPKARSIYTAREMAQLTPLVDRGSIYSSLLHQNSWIKSLLPNISFPGFSSSEEVNSSYTLGKIDDLLFFLQKKYMSISNEKVTKNLAKFHPRNTGMIVMYLYNNRLSGLLGQSTAKRVIYYQQHISVEKN